MSDKLSQSVLRLLEAMSSRVESQLPGPAIVREIYFRVLGSEEGASMRAALASHGRFGKIAIRRSRIVCRPALALSSGKCGRLELLLNA